MSYAPPRPRAQTSQRAAGRFGVFSTTAALTVLALVLLMPSSAIAGGPPASASWHGRAIQDPHPGGDGVTMPASFPAGWSAGAVRIGTGFRHQGGSERVREVQRRLWNLGYRPGLVDGRFGPQTRAAVQWFQIKHGLRPDGVVRLGTLAVLRARTGVESAARPAQEPVRNERPAARGAAPQPHPAAQPADESQTPAAGGRRTAIAMIGLVAIALLLLAAPAALALSAVRRRTKTPKPRRPAANSQLAADPAPQSAAAARSAAAATSPTTAAAPSPVGAAAPGPNAAPTPSRDGAAAPKPDTTDASEADITAAPSREPVIAIGYVCSTRDRADLAHHAGAIRRACTSRGWRLGELVRDDQAGSRTFERPGLAAVMERLSGPGASRLVVSKLAHLSRSATDLRALFEWFGQNDVQVIATDVGIDTTTPQGRRAAHSVLAKVVERQAQALANGTGRNGTQNGTHNGTHSEAIAEVAAGAEPSTQPAER